MAKGLRLPLGVNARGAGATVKEQNQAKKIIWLALSDLDNENAFQQEIGLAPTFIFGLPGVAFRSFIQRRLIDIFKDFEDLRLFKLIRSTIRFSREVDGEEVVTFKYIDLETDEEQLFEKRFLSKGR